MKLRAGQPGQSASPRRASKRTGFDDVAMSRAAERRFTNITHSAVLHSARPTILGTR